jgi:hypothetical protein
MSEWSAPCAIALTSAQANVQETQESILLFMTEAAIYSLVTRAVLSLNETHRWGLRCVGVTLDLS